VAAAQKAAKQIKAEQARDNRREKAARNRLKLRTMLTRPAVGPVSARFGQNKRYWEVRHTGVDIDADYGTRVRNVMAGKVIRATTAPGYGKIVIIRSHHNGLDFWYAHLSKIDVRVGQPVRSGQTIGRVGNSGNSTGPHLHLEIRRDDMPINPSVYIWGKNKGKLDRIKTPRWVRDSRLARLSDI
jgi:murein DD-endopeptidase MepM/ murein hydrolase activator NlpD